MANINSTNQYAKIKTKQKTKLHGAKDPKMNISLKLIAAKC